MHGRRTAVPRHRLRLYRGPRCHCLTHHLFRRTLQRGRFDSFPSLLLLCYLLLLLQAEGMLSDLVDLMDRKEPRNAPLSIKMAELFSRISGRNPNILQQTKTLCERALNVQKTAEHQAELAKQLRMLGQNKVALKAYRQALEMEASTADSLLGIFPPPLPVPL